MGMFDRFYNPPEAEERESDAERITGVRLVAHVAFSQIWALIKLNVLFVLSCLPVVTIPMSCAAASSVCVMLLERRPVFVWHDFWKAFAANWKRAAAAGWSLLAVVVLGVIGTWFYSSSNIPGGYILAGLAGAFGIWAFAAATYVFPMVLSTDLGIKDLIRNSALLVPMRFPQNLALMVFDLLMIGIGVLLIPYTIWFLPLIGCMLIALVGTWNAGVGIAKVVVE